MRKWQKEKYVKNNEIKEILKKVAIWHEICYIIKI